ncbi:ATP-binding protein [Streptomyces sp. NPDC050287]|uniref:ATP-binding protein n=1 Tax=Streptomyces sp. NPDC050287 TaxID=3365608 RepID=UPI0037A5A887
MRRPALPRWAGTLAAKAAVFITVMCCALAALLGVLVHVSVTNQTVGQARDLALSRLTDATAAFEAGETMPPGAGVDPPDLPDPLRHLAAAGEHGTMVGEYQGQPTMWAAGPVDGGRALAVEVDYAQGKRTIDGLDRSIVWSSGLAIGATLLVGAVAVTRVTRRLQSTAQVARRISAGDLDARVGDPRTKDPSRPQDEVAAVAAALDSMAASLQGKLLSEQRFTADVAHELRTPLTGRVVRASGTDTEVVVVRDAAVETDRRRLERVLGNLVANAHRHGRGPVVVTVDGAAVTVRDHGDGYPRYLVEHGPQRFRTEGGATGHGLGLTIACGQAEALGATLAFRNAPDGGAVAELTLRS